MKKHFLLHFLFIALACHSRAQDAPLEARLRKHLSYLASDKLGGRLTGSKNEKKAYDYILAQFQAIGLQQLSLTDKKSGASSPSWIEPFEFNAPLQYGRHNSFEAGGHKYILDKDFYPVAYSADGEISGKVVNLGYGIPDSLLPGNYEYDKPGIANQVFLINLSVPADKFHDTRFESIKSWRTRLAIAKTHHPKAIIFYNASESLSLENFKAFNNLQRDNIPMNHVSEDVAKALIAEGSPEAKMAIHLKRDNITGHNVLGLIDNGKANTIIIGAHYDHLGKGELGNSLYRGKPAVHNGADDNASGTAALIELARIIKTNGPANHNYLFIAFSGEEEGLIGSKHFANNCETDFAPPFLLSKVDYMLNMDMIGRMDSTNLAVNGTGTSPAWDSVINTAIKGKLKIKTSVSGMGPSDQTSFYLKNIPALHFFTGAHMDYHKPSDDVDKINFGGMALVTQYITGIVQNLDTHPKLVFTKTKEDTSQKVRFKVTLGIIPDYIYDKGGLRADGISSGKPAEKAGLKAGDIIIKLGNNEVKDMSTYMEALGKFSKGQETEVTVKRGDTVLKLPVKF